MSTEASDVGRTFLRTDRPKAEQLAPAGPTDSEYYQPYEGDDEFHLQIYLSRVKRHKWIVVVVTTILTTAAAVYLFNQPRVFQAEARVQVDSENEASLLASRSSVSPFEDRAYFNTQLELLESPEFIRNVVRTLELDKDPEFLSGFQTGSIAPSSHAIAASIEDDAERLNPIVESIIDSLKVEPVVQPRQTVKDTRLISIRFRHREPRSSAKVTNAVADQLVTSNLDKRLEATTSELSYLQANIFDLKSQIRRDELRLLEFGRIYQLPSEDEKQNILVERLAGLNRQLLEAENERKQAEAAFRSSLTPGVAASLAEMNAKPISDIEAKLDDLRQKRAQLLVEATEKHPEVQEIDKQITVLDNAAKEKRERATSMLRTSLEARYREAVSREESIRKSLNQQWGQTLEQNTAAISFRTIQQDLQANRKLLDDMQQREKENEMLKAKSPNNIRVVDYAMTPSEPLDRKSAQYLGIAFLFSFAAGIGGALLRDYFDDAVHSRREVERTLNLPALVAIPQVRGGILGRLQGTRAPERIQLTGSHGFSSGSKSRERLIVAGNQLSPLYEGFRHLRTVLTLSPEIGLIKTLLVTSCRQAEGKTTTAVNIASSLAQAGSTVLLIDADLRNPQLHKIFNQSLSLGLSDILTGDLNPAEIHRRVMEDIGNLYFLPAGASSGDRVESLDSERMRELLDSLEPAFDYIVIDSPPVTAFADSSILAAMADGVLLVVQENRNSTETLRQTRRTLDLVGANLVGIVLNKASSVTLDYGYQYRN